MKNNSTLLEKPTENQKFWFYLIIILVGVLCLLALVGLAGEIHQAPHFLAGKYAPLGFVLAFGLCFVVMFLLGIFDPEEETKENLPK